MPPGLWRYLLRKVALAVPLLWCVITLIFVLLELSPGDVTDKFFNPETPPEVREMLVAKYGLDEPAWIRYGYLLRNLATFDFGHSMDQGRPVFDIIASALPNTLLLSSVSLVVIFATGLTVGTLQAVRHGEWVDTGLSVVSLALYSMPEFLLALLAQLLVAFWWSGWLARAAADHTIPAQLAELGSLPFSGVTDPMAEYAGWPWWVHLLDRAKHLVLPGIAMALASAGGTARYMRSAVLEVTRQDYVRTARAKGLREHQVIVRHAVRNALLPVITLMGLSIPALFSGTVVVETIFAWPGMGRVIVEAIRAQDTPLIVACFYVYTLLVLAGNLLADLAYAWADPRIRYE
ncbi:MAG: ABC transporter permease [Myxococcota bacterium]